MAPRQKFLFRQGDYKNKGHKPKIWTGSSPTEDAGITDIFICDI
jgi:hypothetical protein